MSRTQGAKCGPEILLRASGDLHLGRSQGSGKNFRLALLKRCVFIIATLRVSQIVLWGFPDEVRSWMMLGLPGLQCTFLRHR